MQFTPRPAVLAFTETKPDGVVHCWASTGRLTRVISTGAPASAPCSRRLRPALGPPLADDGGLVLDEVSVGSGIPLMPVWS